MLQSGSLVAAKWMKCSGPQTNARWTCAYRELERQRPADRPCRVFVPPVRLLPVPALAFVRRVPRNERPELDWNRTSHWSSDDAGWRLAGSYCGTVRGWPGSARSIGIRLSARPEGPICPRQFVVPLNAADPRGFPAANYPCGMSAWLAGLREGTERPLGRAR